MPASRLSRVLCAALLALVAACRPSFQSLKFPTNTALYQAAFAKYKARQWDDALWGFERLTTELPARDTLLPLASYYAARSHEEKGDYILAAQAFTRLTESFPDDTLSDDALVAAGRDYAKMWRKPDLDAEYGETALNTFRTLLALYPNSPLRDAAQKEIDRLNQWFATKTYDDGLFYLRRKGFDSAIIYFKDVVSHYPDTPRTKDALLRLVEAYRAIKYKTEADEACTSLWTKYPTDREVAAKCGAGPMNAVKQKP